MKIKTWHLFVVITILFACSFFIVNLKFDEFYRVKGINNDNRVLIEKYLDQDEQTYLKDNQIPIELFIDYIQEDDFYLENYRYYNALKDSGRYKKTKKILETGNSLAMRLTYLYKNDPFEPAQTLIDNHLELAFLNEETFQFDYINLYTQMQPLYKSNDFSYIKDTAFIVEQLNEQGIKSQEKLTETFTMLTNSYSKNTLKQLFSTPLDDDVSIVYNPHELSTLVNQTHYIGTYEPTDLLMTQDIPRVRYAMYLQRDAYYALLKMYEELSNQFDDFLLREAYISPESLTQDQIGFKEEQLGLTILVSKSEIIYADFEKTDLSSWLETHAYEYGFVLRYPKGKASVTNHAYDAHIYRYVGKNLAKFLYEEGLTLEEYQSQLS